MTISAYLFFNGNCEEAFKFYEKAVGGKVDAMMRHAGSPAEGEFPPEWKDKILHASLKIGDTWLMASDAPPGYQEKMSGFSVSHEVETEKEAERVFKALSEGGTVKMPMAETFWAKRFGMLTDKFGTPWMIGCSKPM